MKATQLIERLSSLVEEHGDRVVTLGMAVGIGEREHEGSLIDVTVYGSAEIYFELWGKEE